MAHQKTLDRSPPARYDTSLVNRIKVGGLPGDAVDIQARRLAPSAMDKRARPIFLVRDADAGLAELLSGAAG